MGKEKKKSFLIIVVTLIVLIGAVFAIYKGIEGSFSKDQVSMQEKMKSLRTHR